MSLQIGAFVRIPFRYIREIMFLLVSILVKPRFTFDAKGILQSSYSSPGFLALLGPEFECTPGRGVFLQMYLAKGR